jgi:hypothetical protein
MELDWRSADRAAIAHGPIPLLENSDYTSIARSVRSAVSAWVAYAQGAPPKNPLTILFERGQPLWLVVP